MKVKTRSGLLFVIAGCIGLTTSAYAQNRGYYPNQEYSKLEGDAMEESEKVGRGIAGILGFLARAGEGYLRGDRNPNSLISSGKGGAHEFAPIGGQAGKKQAIKQIGKTRLSYAKRQEAAAQLRNVKSSVVALGSYNQSLEVRIAELKRTKSRPAARKAHTEAVVKQKTTATEVQALRSYAQQLPPSTTRDKVNTAANQLESENRQTATLVGELSKLMY